MDRKFLEGFGLEKEQIDQILNSHSEQIGRIKKQQQDEAGSYSEQISKLEEDLKNAKASISTLETEKGDSESLKAKLETSEKELTALRQKASEDAIEAALRIEALKLGAINPETVMPLVSRDNISIKDGAVEGAKEAIEAVKEDEANAFLFSGAARKGDIPERGGYEATAGEKVEEGIGAAMAKSIIEAEKANRQSADSFWDAVTPR